MKPETVFYICNFGIVPAWALLVFAPNWKWTGRIVHAIWIPLILALFYGWAFISSPKFPEGGSFNSLEGVMALFTNPYIALAGWVHYLVFDLFVGAWEVRDAKREKIHHGIVIPCLIFTFILGPIGLLLFLIIRLILRRKITLNDCAPHEKSC